jgi:hypothetical protein
MEIQIPGDVPVEDHDRYCQAFLAGYKHLKMTDGWDANAVRAIRDSYPEAFDAGVTAAWRKQPR